MNGLNLHILAFAIESNLRDFHRTISRSFCIFNGQYIAVAILAFYGDIHFTCNKLLSNINVITDLVLTIINGDLGRSNVRSLRNRNNEVLNNSIDCRRSYRSYANVILASTLDKIPTIIIVVKVSNSPSLTILSSRPCLSIARNLLTIVVSTELNINRKNVFSNCRLCRQQQIPNSTLIVIVPRQADAIQILLVKLSQIHFNNTILVSLNIHEHILTSITFCIVTSILLSINLMVHVEHELHFGRGYNCKLAVSREISNNILRSLANDHVTITKHNGMSIST